MAERHIQTIKGIIKKSVLNNSDLNLALLQYRNTPLTGTYSPAQVLMSRNLRMILPSTNRNLQPKLIDARQYNIRLEKTKRLSEQYYNKKGREYPNFTNSQTVYVQTKPNSIWLPGKVIEKLSNRRFKVRLDSGSILVRNKKYLKHCKPETNNIEVNSKCQTAQAEIKTQSQDKIFSSVQF